MRERNNSQGVRVPSKLESYDYASRHVTVQRAVPVVEVKPPTPAGSYPISPHIPQRAWDLPERTIKTEVHEKRHIDGLSNITPPQAPASTQSSIRMPPSPASCYQIYRADSTAGASRSPPSSSPVPATIKARVKLKPTIVKEEDPVQTESRYSLYNTRATDASSTRSSSPVKSMPNFTASNEVEGDSIFGYKTRDTERTVAGASLTASSDREKALEKTRQKLAERAKEKTPKRTLTTRWPWLRPSVPRTAQPTTIPVAFSLHAEKSAPTAPYPIDTVKNTAYIDPFTSPTSSTPPSLLPPRPPSPRKLATHHSPPAPLGPVTPTFDTGLAQIKSFTYIVVKIGLLLYAFVALWFVLDAVREAIHTIGVLFRVLAGVGAVVLDVAGWVWEWVVVGWRLYAR